MTPNSSCILRISRYGICDIKNLIRNNLNDLTIQDIERIKRMLEEGEKLKPDTQ